MEGVINFRLTKVTIFGSNHQNMLFFFKRTLNVATFNFFLLFQMWLTRCCWMNHY